MVVIEKARETDLEEIVEIENESFDDPWSLYAFESELTNLNSVFLIAKINNEIVGYVIMRCIGDEGHILNLAVKEKYRRKGIGGALLEEIIKYSNSMNIKKLTLEVRQNNFPAINLYKKYNFEIVGERKRFYNTKNAYIMKKILVILLSLYSSLSCLKPSHHLYLKGLVYKSYGNIIDAIRTLEEAKKFDPQSPYIQKELLLLYITIGDKEKIDETLKSLREVTPKEDIELRKEIANLELLINKEKALQHYEELYKLDETDIEVINQLALLYSQIHPQKALEFVEKSLKFAPEQANIHLLKGDIYKTLKATEAAKQSYIKALELQPRFITPYIELSSIYIEEKNYNRAVDVVENLYSLEPKNILFLTTLLEVSYRAKETKKLQELIENDLKRLTKDSDTINYWLSKLCELKSDYSSAIKHLKKIKTKSLNVYLEISYYFSQLNKQNESIKYIKKALKIDKKNPETYLLLGITYFDLKRYKQAIKALHKTLELNPSLPEAHFYLGTSYELIGEFEKAVEHLKKVLDLQPSNHIALNNLGYMYVERETNLEIAEEMIKKALEHDPENPAYIDSYGWLLYKKGEYEAAEEYLIKASEKTNDPIIFDHVGDVKLKLNKKREAIKYYEKAIKLNPKNKNKIKKKIKAIRIAND